MELAVELLAKLLESREVQVTFPELSLSAAELAECASYRALCRIQGILKDDTLSDQDCFQKIEEIVSVFEESGASCGSRHDFG